MTRMGCWRSAAVAMAFLSAGIAVAGFRPAAAADDVGVDLVQVRERLREQRDKLRALHVRYGVTLEPRVAPELLLKWRIADNFAYNLLAGGSRLEHIEVRRHDEVFLD